MLLGLGDGLRGFREPFCFRRRPMWHFADPGHPEGLLVQLSETSFTAPECSRRRPMWHLVDPGRPEGLLVTLSEAFFTASDSPKSSRIDALAFVKCTFSKIEEKINKT